MADLSWLGALVGLGGSGGEGGSGGSSGVTNYDQLTNRPVSNIKGSGIVINALPTGVYNISGTWKFTDDDAERSTLDDDLFYVLNEGAECKMTWISAGTIKTFSSPSGGTAADIVEQEITGGEYTAEELVGTF